MGAACQRLTAANVPHNLFIADAGARVFLFPNCFAERKARGLIPEGARAGRGRGAAVGGGAGGRCPLHDACRTDSCGPPVPRPSPPPPPPPPPARCPPPADVLETQVDPAAWEIAGHIVLKRQQDYDAVTQGSAWRLLELASASEERFAEVARLALEGLL